MKRLGPEQDVVSLAFATTLLNHFGPETLIPPLLKEQRPVTNEPVRYYDTYRRTLLDMHIPDWDQQFLSEYEPV